MYVCCLLTLNAEDLKQRSVINKHRNTVRASMPALRLKISTTLWLAHFCFSFFPPWGMYFFLFALSYNAKDTFEKILDPDQIKR